MQGEFTHNSSDSPIVWSGFPPGSEDTNNNTTNTANDMVGNITPPDLRDSDIATLIGVVSEPVDLERLSDAQLMVAAADGNCSAFEKLYDRHVRSCFGLAVKIVQEPSLAEDIVQETFIKLWSRPESFSSQRGNFNTWLLTVVRNKAVDKLREIKSRSPMLMLPLHIEKSISIENSISGNLVEVVPDPGPTPHDQVWTKETGGVVRDALRQLSASEYQTIALAYFGGLSQHEIADKLRQPLGTVKTRTRSALRRLHYLLVAQGALSD